MACGRGGRRSGARELDKTEIAGSGGEAPSAHLFVKGSGGGRFGIEDGASETYSGSTLEAHVAHLADFHLAQRCLDGEPEALAWLRHHLQSVVVSDLIRSGAEVAEAGDLCEWLLADLIMPEGKHPPRLLRYAGTSALGTWLHAVALNRLIDKKRAMQRHQQTPLQPLDEESADEIEPAWMKDPRAELAREAPLLELMRDAIEAAFRNCDPEDFVLLQLSHCNRLMGRELAKIFGCHPAQISRRLLAAEKEIASTTLRHIRQSDPWLELRWEDFTDLCRTATPACFGLD